MSSAAEALREALRCGDEQVVEAAVRRAHEAVNEADAAVPLLPALCDALWWEGARPTGRIADWTSESDASDASGRGGLLVRRDRRSGKLRMHVLSAVTDIARKFPRQCWTHWALFLPDRASLQQWPQRPTLVTILIYDSSSRARGAAASCLAALVQGSNRLLSALGKKNLRQEAHGFLSLAERLSRIANELYIALAFAIKTEPNPTCLAQMLKALSVLVYNVSPPAVSEEAIVRLLPELWCIMRLETRSSMTARSAAFSCLVTLITTNSNSCGALKASIERCGVLRSTLEKLTNSETDPLTAEGLALVAAISFSFPEVLIEQWDQVRSMLDIFLTEEEKSTNVIRLHAIRCLSHLASRASVQLPLDVWRMIIQCYLLFCLKDSFHTVREEALKCVSEIPHVLYNDVDADHMKALCSLTVLCLRDSASSVRIEATRALSQFCWSASQYISADAVLESLSNVVENDVSAVVRSKALKGLAVVAERSVKAQQPCSQRSLDRAWQATIQRRDDRVCNRPVVARTIGQLACLAFTSNNPLIGEEAVESVQQLAMDQSQSLKTRLSALLSMNSFVHSAHCNAVNAKQVVRCCAIVSSGLSGTEASRQREVCFQMILHIVQYIVFTEEVLDFVVSNTKQVDADPLPLEQRNSLLDLLGQILLSVLSLGSCANPLSQFVQKLAPSTIELITSVIIRSLSLPPLHMLLKDCVAERTVMLRPVIEPKHVESLARWIDCLSFPNDNPRLHSVTSVLTWVLNLTTEDSSVSSTPAFRSLSG